LALIDYFSELSFVRDGASINFQKASCTLDGCVKIYSSRVDSVVDETGKLLNGLADGNFRHARPGQEDEADSNEAEDEEGESGQKKRPVRKASRHASTLEKNPEALCLKQFELEHTVDPLFRKTCAEFDESSSRGSLMHSLSLSASCQVVFDSADSTRLGSEDPAKIMLSGGSVNLSILRNSIGSTALASVSDRRLCAPFAEYSLADGRSARLAEEQMAKAMERLSKINIGPINSALPASGPAPMELDGQVFDAPYDSGPDDDDFAPLMDDDYGGAEGMFSDAEPADDHEPIAMATEQTGFSRGSQGLDSMFSYFDDSVKQQSWAGPNHWKVRRPTFIRQPNADPAKKTGTRQRKDFSLDFDDQVAEVDVEALFAKPANASTITLTKAQIEDRALKDNLLPEDLHFSSVNFLRLFTKPAWRFGTSQAVSYRQVIRPRAAAEQIDYEQDRVHPEIEGDFWAQNAHPEGVADVNHGIQ
jgi:condensin complex subunit 2